MDTTINETSDPVRTVQEPVLATEGTKICTGCGIEKPRTEFWKQRCQRDGLRPRCKKCVYADNKAWEKTHREAARAGVRRWRNSEKGKAWFRAYHPKYSQRPEVKERVRIQANKRYHANPEPAKRYRKEKYWENPGEARRKEYEWRKANPEKAREIRRKIGLKRTANPILNFSDRVRDRLRVVLKRNGIAKSKKTFDLLGYTPSQLYARLSPFLGNPCPLCGKVILTMETADIDHIVQAGYAQSITDVVRLNALLNLRLICESCNCSRPRPFMSKKRRTENVGTLPLPLEV
jgi:hypothetical protein